MKHVGRVNVFQTSEDLVQKVANVIVAKTLKIKSKYFFIDSSITKIGNFLLLTWVLRSLYKSVSIKHCTM